MIVRKGQPAVKKRDEPDFGAMETACYSDFGALKQYGAYVQTLAPGSRSSTRHWHEKEDEFLYVLSGEVTVIENDGAHVLTPGDAACWPAGVANAHHVLNQSDAPCSYLIVGTRLTHDVCHYPDVGKTLYTEGETWRVEDAAGRVLKSGRVEPDL
ncbi:MAG: cupin domain-containing protein [Burkholderiaceae bacterium]